MTLIILIFTLTLWQPSLILVGTKALNFHNQSLLFSFNHIHVFVFFQVKHQLFEKTSFSKPFFFTIHPSPNQQPSLERPKTVHRCRHASDCRRCPGTAPRSWPSAGAREVPGVAGGKRVGWSQKTHGETSTHGSKWKKSMVKLENNYGL